MWLNAAILIEALAIYSNTTLTISPLSFDGLPFRDLRTLTLSNVDVVQQNGDSLRLAVPSADVATTNNKNTFIGICENFRGTLRELEVQFLHNNNPMAVIGNVTLTSLEIVYFRHSRFRDSIHGAIFEKMPALKSMRLPNNNIRHIWPKAFDAVSSSLTYLDLRNNLLNRVTPGLFDAFTALSLNLIFDGNPWHCDCSQYVKGFDQLPCLQQDANMCSAVTWHSQATKITSVATDFSANTRVNEDLTPTVQPASESYTSSLATTATESYRVEDKLEDELEEEEQERMDTERWLIDHRNREQRMQHIGYGHRLNALDNVDDLDDVYNTRQNGRQEDTNTVEIECVDYHDPENTETIRVQCRDYLMQISEVDSTTLRVELEESLPNYVLIWFNDSMVTVLEHETTEDDISCMSDLNTTNIITDLEAGLTYTFCILEKTSITISPFNCAAYYLARKETSPIWISTDKKSLTIGIAVALFVVFTWLGLVFGIFLVRRNPTWLKGTKRVVIVDNRNNFPQMNNRTSTDLSVEDNSAVDNR